MCKLLDATKVPYILMYKREGGKVAEFACTPSKIQLLIDALHEHALPPEERVVEGDEVEQELETERVLEEEEMRVLAEGNALMQEIMPQIRAEARYAAEMMSFEEFCMEHTRRKHSNQYTALKIVRRIN